MLASLTLLGTVKGHRGARLFTGGPLASLEPPLRQTTVTASCPIEQRQAGCRNKSKLENVAIHCHLTPPDVIPLPS